MRASMQRADGRGTGWVDFSEVRGVSASGSPLHQFSGEEANDRLIEVTMKRGPIEAWRVRAYRRHRRDERISTGREEYEVIGAKHHMLLGWPWQSLPHQGTVPRIRCTLILLCTPQLDRDDNSLQIARSEHESSSRGHHHGGLDAWVTRPDGIREICV